MVDVERIEVLFVDAVDLRRHIAVDAIIANGNIVLFRAVLSSDKAISIRPGLWSQHLPLRQSLRLPGQSSRRQTGP